MRLEDGDGLILFHDSFDTALDFAFSDICSTIVFFFSSSYGELEFHKSPLTIQANGDQSQAFGTDFPYKRRDVSFLEEKLSRPGIFMGNFLPGMAVAGDEGIGEPEFTIVDSHKSTSEASVAGFDASYFGTSQDNTSLKVVLETVVVASSSVVSNDFTHISDSIMAQKSRKE